MLAINLHLGVFARFRLGGRTNRPTLRFNCARVSRV
jgi:hypothetical protein